MGDRANVVVLDYWKADVADEVPAVYLYAHWGGERLHKVAREALNSDAARDRWGDSSYLTRILFHQILNEMADPNDSLGFGLSASLTDNEYDILVIDPVTQRATFRKQGSEAYPVVNDGLSFEEFIATHRKGD